MFTPQCKIDFTPRTCLDATTFPASFVLMSLDVCDHELFELLDDDDAINFMMTPVVAVAVVDDAPAIKRAKPTASAEAEEDTPVANAATTTTTTVVECAHAPTTHVNDRDQDNTCTICMADFDTSEVTRFGCPGKHRFHTACHMNYVRTFMKKRTYAKSLPPCPNCRWEPTVMDREKYAARLDALKTRLLQDTARLRTLNESRRLATAERRRERDELNQRHTEAIAHERHLREELTAAIRRTRDDMFHLVDTKGAFA